MGEVVNFPNPARVIAGELVKQPKSKAEYLATCKRFLSIPEYEFILMAILDQDYYNMADDHLVNIVDAYNAFEY
jgi:hypothetical protein